ncbi:copper-binding protein [Pseudoduganella violaceinigra]|uniref:copper-binding protein n=1 Tax=Pseudoduganella violaceinigra TaxID=246602 RepID=UPI000406E559|nr:copper-binding protein [Pseudoduganella violaceinigra]
MKTFTSTLLAAALAAACLAGAPAQARQVVTDPARQAVVADTAEGEIRKVDKPSGKLTIKHGELKNLGMGAMTMVFRAKDAAMLDKVKAGDKVRFSVESADGTLTVTDIDVVK